MSGHRILYHHRIGADDGQAVHVRELIDALRAQGHVVRECALVPKAAGASPGASGRILQRLSLPRRLTELLEIGYGRRGLAMLRREAAEFAPDFVYERHALHCDVGLKLAGELGCPLLLEVNAPMCDEMARLGLLRYGRRARRIEAEVLGGADAVLAVSAVLRERLIALGAPADRSRVIANGAVPERYGEATRQAAASLRAGLPRGAFLLGFVGFARPWHRLDLALDALARPGLEAVHLRLLGSGPALPVARAQAARLGLGTRLQIAGTVTPRELPAQVAALDASLIPAINSYASPLKLFDSLAAGVVTLAPDQPNLRELIAHERNGLLFEPGSVEALASALRGLVANPDQGRRLGEAGRQSLLARNWTWAGNAVRVVQAYQELRG